MQHSKFTLSDTRFSSISRRWLLIGVWSLAIAGLFSLSLVIARTPGFCDVPFFMKLFHKALVVHVDLSVLVWFLSIACMFWSLVASGRSSFFPYLEEAAQICFVIGMVFIAVSALDPNAEAVMSNYIPVITSPLFFLGLSLLLCGVGLMLARLFTSSPDSGIFPSELTFAVRGGGLVAVFAIFAFIWSFRLLPPQINGGQYYELGFWGGGHVLQFVHIQIMLVGWLLLMAALKPDFTISRKIIYALFSVAIVMALLTPLPYLLFEVTSSQSRAFFTDGMIVAGGIAPSILAVFLIPSILRLCSETKGKKRALWSSLFMSLVLFIYGGILGSLIHGQNVVIPAHYHGSIVGVTLAFMGVAYLLLPYFGYRDVVGGKLAFWQPLIYGFGQILHISGLAYSGGYGGLQRKTPCGGGVEIATDIKIAMGFMGLGGLLAIIGGLMFVIVVIGSVYARKKA